MPQQTAPRIELSERSGRIIEEIARQRSAQYRLVIRVSLMLAMADGLGNNELARQRNLDRGVVRNWRNRWLDLQSRLAAAEAADISDEDLRDLILTGLSDLPRRWRAADFHGGTDRSDRRCGLRRPRPK